MIATSLDLIFHSPASLLSSVDMKLKLLKLFASILRDAGESLRKFYLYKEFWFFDPHVGETSCQIRALRLMLLNLNEDNQNNEDIIQLITLVDMKYYMTVEKIKAYEKFDENTQNKKDAARHIILKDFFLENELYFELSLDTKFLVLSYILTKFKIENSRGETYIDFEKISVEYNVSRKLAKKISHDYQVKLAEDSVFFIKSIATNVENFQYLSWALEKFEKRDDDNRPVLPCYFATKIIIFNIFKFGIPVLFIVKSKNFLCENNEIFLVLKKDIYANKFIFETVISKHDILTEWGKTPFFVIEGFMENYDVKRINLQKYLQNFVKNGLHDMILGYMANHPQYSGERLKPYAVDPFAESTDSYKENGDIFKINRLKNELVAMRALGQRIGCSFENKSLFFIEHIFCDTLQHQVFFRWKKKMLPCEVVETDRSLIAC